jgi:hypothetical protein
MPALRLAIWWRTIENNALVCIGHKFSHGTMKILPGVLETVS